MLEIPRRRPYRVFPNLRLRNGGWGGGFRAFHAPSWFRWFSPFFSPFFLFFYPLCRRIGTVSVRWQAERCLSLSLSLCSLHSSSALHTTIRVSRTANPRPLTGQPGKPNGSFSFSFFLNQFSACCCCCCCCCCSKRFEYFRLLFVFCCCCCCCFNGKAESENSFLPRLLATLFLPELYRVLPSFTEFRASLY